jgi:S-adenosylmethionine hydrolase
VVDPGVGTARRPIGVSAADHLFVGPDNGLFWPIAGGSSAAGFIHLTEPGYFLTQVSATFHGRDVFAPVAAHLSLVTELSAMGEIISNPVRLEITPPERRGDVLVGHVIRVDRFGNLVSDIKKSILERFLEGKTPMIFIGDVSVYGLSTTYGDAESGEMLALIGSSDTLEVSVNRGSASKLLGDATQASIGMEIEVRPVLGRSPGP